MNIGGFFTTGGFIIQNSNIIDYIILSSIGIASIIFGASCVNYKLNPKHRKTEIINRLRVYKNTFIILIIIRVLVIMICDQMNIGRVGVTPQPLILKITGILYYLNNILLPILTTYMCLVALTNNQNKLFNRFILANLLVAIILAFTTNSKFAIISALLPVGIYIIDSSLTNKNIMESHRKYLLCGIILLPFSYIILDYKRHLSDHELFTLEAFLSFISNYNAGHELLSPINAILQSITLRITGGTELMAVMAGGSIYQNSIWNLITDKHFMISEFPGIIEDIFGIKVSIDGGTSTGKSFGLFGLVYLTKDIFVYALELFLFGALIALYEKCVRAINGMVASILLSLQLIINIWEGSFDNFIFYLTLPLMLYIFNMALIVKRDPINLNRRIQL